MYGKIVIISPDEKFTQYSKDVVERLNEDIDVIEGSFSVGLGKARKAERDGAGIIISRGGTGKLIKNNVSVPVVNIDFSSYDVINSLSRAMDYSHDIGIIGFEDLADAYESVRTILEKTFKASINVCTISSTREIEGCVNLLYKKGSRVFIGGHQVVESVESKRLDAVLIETGKTAIIDAIKYSHRLLEVQKIEKEKAAILKSIIDFAYDGILGIDQKGKVTVFNPVIQRLTGISYDDAIGELVDNVVENSRMTKVLKSGESELGEIQKIKGTTIITNRVPIIVDNKTVGVVATFQEVEKIQKMETHIRTKLHAKGHVAKTNFEDIIGNSSAISNSKAKATLYSQVESTILIQGETGTGKELFSQSIHNASGRRDKPFVAVNCAALPENLLESELFGYVEGAFTGARKGGKTGLFELAHGGTIFLDEISEMSMSIQARFLRVIQEKEVVRLGDDKIIPVDIRVIGATNRDLLKQVQEMKFREDLYYRLCVLTLEIPPLRMRKDDIHDLVDYFLMEKSRELNIKTKGIDHDAMARLLLYDWPGNIRQLENLVERCVVLSRDKEISVEVMDEAISGIPQLGRGEDYQYTEHEYDGKKGVLKQIEKDTIMNVLEETGGNKTLAAEKLGISVTTLWRKLKSME
ncbi:MAG: sigma 54-interacting transcriptional regulator [Gudongella sp.]|nr:sigma 54-interacting transcriptional regulator [Gudongella sp.]